MDKLSKKRSVGTRSKRKKTPVLKYTLALISYAALFVFCVVVAASSARGSRVTYEAGSISTETIVAPRDFVDEKATQLKKDEAAGKVEAVYQIDEVVLQQSENQIAAVFTSIDQVRQEARQDYIDAKLALDPLYDTASFSYGSADWAAFLVGDAAKYLDKLPDYFTKQNVITFLSVEKRTIDSLKDVLVERVRTELKAGIMADELSAELESIRSSLVSAAFSQDLAAMAHSVAQNTVLPNMVFDQAATNARRQEAIDAVVPVTYKKGQTIVREGDVVTANQYDTLVQLGLVNTASNNTAKWVSTSLFMSLLFILGLLYALYADKSVYQDQKVVFNIISLSVLSVLVALIYKQIDLRLMPVFLPVIIAAVSLRRRTALLFSVFASIITALIMAPDKAIFFDEQVMRMLLAQMLGSVSAIFVLRKKQKRGEYLLAGLCAGLAASVVYVCYGILNQFTWTQLAITCLFATASAVIGAVVALGVLPVWESIFSLVTPTRLLELTNPSQPLLRRLMVEAPGTYHHSAMVANLAEAAAEVVGGDGLMCRVAAYYHDVGKLVVPLMFKENQLNMGNPHDSLAPEESAQIIRRHVPDGVKMLEKANIPVEMIEIISQHHGDGLVGYFYHKAKENGSVEEADFRYPGKKPQSKEAGILMLADIVEAAVRANNAATAPDLKEQIAKLVYMRYDDGSLDDCPLTRRDIRDIIDAFYHVFEGASHQRVVYPQGSSSNRVQEAENREAIAQPEVES